MNNILNKIIINNNTMAGHNYTNNTIQNQLQQYFKQQLPHNITAHNNNNNNTITISIHIVHQQQ